MPAGNVSYAIKSRNAYGEGNTIIDSVYVGVDAPKNIENFTLIADEENTSATLTWNVPQGQNGGFIDYEGMTYSIYRYDLGSGQFEVYKENLTDTVLVISDSIAAEQQVYYYAVSATLNTFETEPTIGYVVLGSIYSAPFEESFKDSRLATSPWITAGASSNDVWTTTEEISTADGLYIYPQDDDYGMLFFYNPYGHGYGYVESPKMRLYQKNGASNVLSFWTYHVDALASSHTFFTVEISANDGDFESLGDTIWMSESEGWTRHRFDLEEYKAYDYVNIRGTIYAESYTDALILDNFRIGGVFPYDLEAKSISCPPSTMAGDSVWCNVLIENVGSEAVLGDDYTVDLYNQEKMIARVAGADLTMDSIWSVDFSFVPNVAAANTSWELYAKINYNDDQVTSNNTIGYDTLIIRGNDLPTVTDLTGLALDAGTQLNWTMPNINYSQFVFDGFEDNEALAVDTLKGWTMVDRDQQFTYIISGLSYNNSSEAMAFQAWNAVAAGADIYEVLMPYEGAQCAISWRSAGVLSTDGSSVAEANDDWLISPEVKPGSEINFWASLPSLMLENEVFEIWISTTSDDVTDFTKFKTTEIAVVGWNEYSYTLPEDAKYFAIRQTTSGLALMLDNITYIPVDAEDTEYNLLGYNVYQDGEKVNKAILSETELLVYGEESGVFGVSVVYDSGESNLSNLVYMGTADVDEVSMQDQWVYGGQSFMMIENHLGQRIQVYSLSGSLIHDFVCTSNNEKYTLSQGVYMVIAPEQGLASKVVVY